MLAPVTTRAVTIRLSAAAPGAARRTTAEYSPGGSGADVARTVSVAGTASRSSSTASQFLGIPSPEWITAVRSPSASPDVDVDQDGGVSRIAAPATALNTTSGRDRMSLVAPGAPGGAGLGAGLEGTDGAGEALGETGVSLAQPHTDTSSTAKPQRRHHRSAFTFMGNNIWPSPSVGALHSNAENFVRAGMSYW